MDNYDIAANVYASVPTPLKPVNEQSNKDRILANLKLMKRKKTQSQTQLSNGKDDMTVSEAQKILDTSITHYLGCKCALCGLVPTAERVTRLARI
jgi:hypothetical protein